MERKNNQQIILYQSADKHVELEVRLQNETVWLTQMQIAALFDVNVPAISKHIRNIYTDKELGKSSTVSKMEIVRQEGGRFIKRNIEVYSLDMIISVGYRVNSRRATQFRIWATQTLKKYLLDGLMINEKRLREREFDHVLELEQATALLQQTMARYELKSDEAKGLLKVITDYTSSWLLLHKYDQDKLVVEKTKKYVYLVFGAQSSFV